MKLPVEHSSAELWTVKLLFTHTHTHRHEGFANKKEKRMNVLFLGSISCFVCSSSPLLLLLLSFKNTIRHVQTPTQILVWKKQNNEWNVTHKLLLWVQRADTAPRVTPAPNGPMGRERFTRVMRQRSHKNIYLIDPVQWTWKWSQTLLDTGLDWCIVHGNSTGLSCVFRLDVCFVFAK